MWIYLLAFLAGMAAEYASEVFGVKYSNAVTGRYSGLTDEAIRAKVGAARKWGILLFLLSQVDLGALLGGWKLYLSVASGALVGAWIGLGNVMYEKHRRLNDDDD